MSDEPKEIIGALYFSDHEPRIFGHLQIGTSHYEIAGIRKTEVRTDLTGRRIKRKTPIAQTQMDMFDEDSSRSGERKQHQP
jgi:hypothetical protein